MLASHWRKKAWTKEKAAVGVRQSASLDCTHRSAARSRHLWIRIVGQSIRCSVHLPFTLTNATPLHSMNTFSWEHGPNGPELGRRRNWGAWVHFHVTLVRQKSIDSWFVDGSKHDGLACFLAERKALSSTISVNYVRMFWMFPNCRVVCMRSRTLTIKTCSQVHLHWPLVATGGISRALEEIGVFSAKVLPWHAIGNSSQSKCDPFSSHRTMNLTFCCFKRCGFLPIPSGPTLDLVHGRTKIKIS